MNPIDLIGASQSVDDEICQEAKRAKLQHDLQQHGREKDAYALLVNVLQEQQKKLGARAMILRIENNVLVSKLKEEPDVDEEKITSLKSSYIEKLSNVENMYSSLRTAAVASAVNETEEMKDHEIKLAKAKHVKEELLKEFEKANRDLSLIDQEMQQLPVYEAAVIKLKEEAKAKLSELEAISKKIENVQGEINNIGDDFLVKNRELRQLVHEVEEKSSLTKAGQEEEIAKLEQCLSELQAKLEQAEMTTNSETVKLEALETEVEKLKVESNLKVMELCTQYDIPEEWHQNIPDDYAIKSERLLREIEGINKAAATEMADLNEKQRRLDIENQQVQLDLIEVAEQLAVIEEERKQCALKISKNHLLTADTNETKKLIKQSEDELLALSDELIAMRREAQEKRVQLQSDIVTLKRDAEKYQQDIMQDELAFAKQKAAIEGETAVIDSKNKQLLRNIEEAKKIRAAYKEKYFKLTKSNQPKSPIKKVTFNNVVDERSITDESALQN